MLNKLQNSILFKNQQRDKLMLLKLYNNIMKKQRYIIDITYHSKKTNKYFSLFHLLLSKKVDLILIRNLVFIKAFFLTNY
jgi:hypothetical protein